MLNSLSLEYVHGLSTYQWNGKKKNIKISSYVNQRQILGKFIIHDIEELIET